MVVGARTHVSRCAVWAAFRWLCLLEARLQKLGRLPPQNGSAPVDTSSRPKGDVVAAVFDRYNVNNNGMLDRLCDRPYMTRKHAFET